LFNAVVSWIEGHEDDDDGDDESTCMPSSRTGEAYYHNEMGPSEKPQ